MFDSLLRHLQAASAAERAELDAFFFGAATDDLLDISVRRVMSRRWAPQGYMGRIDVSRAYVASWLADGAPLNAWWFAFDAAVRAEYRRLRPGALVAQAAGMSPEQFAAGMSLNDLDASASVAPTVQEFGRDFIDWRSVAS